MYLALQGSARDKIRTIEMGVLSKDDGFEQVIKMLDTVLLKDESTRAYMAFKEFVEYRRKMGESYSAFVVTFEKLHAEISKHKMELPDGAKAYFLLQAANLNEENERLARVSAKMDYANMKETLQKVFGNNNEKEGQCMPIKEEVNYTKKSHANRPWNNNWKHDNYRKQNQNGGERSWRNGNSNWRQPNGRRMNKNGPDGKPLRCYHCGSNEHLSFDCIKSPRRDTYMVEAEDADDVKVAFFTKEKEEKLESIMADAIGFGVLDSACTKTVAGRKWFSEYRELLTEEEQRFLIEKKSPSIYRFGDGEERKALFNTSIPAVVTGKTIYLAIDIVECDIHCYFQRTQ